VLKNKKGEDYIFNTGKHKSMLTYYFTKPNEVINLEYSIPKNANPTIEVQDIKYDLFTNKLLNIEPRKDENLFPTPFVINDATVVLKTIKF